MGHSVGEEKLQHSASRGGTLAIDLGSSTTVVAFQSPDTPTAQLVELSPISRRPGEVPSLVWDNGDQPLIGHQVIEAKLVDSNDSRLHRDFKRLIGTKNTPGTQPRLLGGTTATERHMAKASPRAQHRAACAFSSCGELPHLPKLARGSE
jgi:molecular chaperone DnaK (HSP70)